MIEVKVKQRGDAYEDAKNAIGYEMPQFFYKAFPHLEDKVMFWNVGSPLSHNHYPSAPAGEICGLAHSSYRFSAEVAAGLRPKTDIPGLYLTGQDVYVCGYAGALMGGTACAGSILKRSALLDLFMTYLL